MLALIDYMRNRIISLLVLLHTRRDNTQLVLRLSTFEALKILPYVCSRSSLP